MTTNVPTCDPWAIVRITEQHLAGEGIKDTFTYDDAIGGADPLDAACRLLESLGVEPALTGGQP